MKIGIIADLHLQTRRRPAPGERREPPKEDEKTVKLREFYEKAKELDFVVNLGDLIAGSDDHDADYMTAAMLSRSFISSTVNTYYVLGNRDCMCLPKDLLLHCTEALGGAYSFLREGILFIALDANYSCDGKPYAPGEGDWTDSNVSAGQLAFLEKQLARTDYEKAVILCHQRLDMFMNEFEMLNPHVVSNSEAVRSLLEKSGKTALVLQAHYHSGDDVTQNGIRYFTQPAFMDKEPAKYSVLTVENGEISLKTEIL